LIAEVDCLRDFEQLLLKADVIKSAEVKQLWSDLEEECRKAQDEVRGEPTPTAESIWDHVYSDGSEADWRKF
jgi:2-oxoisovalerate dehydrogenase E1 component alpha subunit